MRAHVVASQITILSYTFPLKITFLFQRIPKLLANKYFVLLRYLNMWPIVHWTEAPRLILPYRQVLAYSIKYLPFNKF